TPAGRREIQSLRTAQHPEKFRHGRRSVARRPDDQRPDREFRPRSAMGRPRQPAYVHDGKRPAALQFWFQPDAVCRRAGGRGNTRYPEKLAYSGDRLEPLTLERPLRASGKISLRRGVSDSTSLIGFFHSRDSVSVSNEQNNGFPMNFLGAAIEGPSREGFFLY